ncbi:MAG: LysR family transcriptional regulator [Oscillospiraceae bacterium]
MDAKKWEALLAAVRLGSFSKAAEELGYTQSGMSYMMNSLEEEIGFPLLVRSWEGVRLTAEGEALLPDIRAVVESHTRLRRHLTELSDSIRDSFCIGTYASLSVHWLSPVMGLFQQERPNTEIELRIGSRRELLQWLESGEIDLALADRLEAPSAEWTPLYDDPLVGVLPKNYSGPAKLDFSGEDLRGLTFLVPSDSSAGGRALKPRLSHRSNVRVKTEDDQVMLSMISRGLGFSILPELSIRGRTEGVAVLPLTQPLFRHLGITKKAGYGGGAAVRRLLQLLRTNLPAPENEQT